MYVSMSTPSFDIDVTSCFTFDYSIYASEETLNYTNTPGLQIYIRSKNYMLSGQQIWSFTGLQKGAANVPLWNDQMPGESKLDFVALVGDPRSTTIDISNVVFRNEDCQNTTEVECQISQFRCRDRQECIIMQAVCNGTSECTDSSDEELPICGEPGRNLWWSWYNILSARWCYTFVLLMDSGLVRHTPHINVHYLILVS